MTPKKVEVFKTQFQPRERVFQNPGNSEHVLYSSRLAEDGSVELIPSGTEDLYAMIQSHRDSVDIHVLLARYNNGDIDALSRVQGTYGDFTQMPSTYAELLNTLIVAENQFNSLPVEVREKFDHSFEKYMVSMDDMPSFLEKMGVTSGSSNPEPVVKDPEPVKEEVTANVS